MYLTGADKNQGRRCDGVFLKVTEKPPPAYEPENLVKVMAVQAETLGDEARRLLEATDEKRRTPGRLSGVLRQRIDRNFSRPWYFSSAPFHFRATSSWRVYFRSFLLGLPERNTIR